MKDKGAAYAFLLAGAWQWFCAGGTIATGDWVKSAICTILGIVFTGVAIIISLPHEPRR